MIFLADTNQPLEQIREELKCEVGELLTPLTRRAYSGGLFAIDNGAFSRFDRNGFFALLERNKQHVSQCKFVAAPDIVGNARRTLEIFKHMRDRLIFWPVALVAQDGLESLDVPWWKFDALFIGGSTEWKLSKHAADLVKTAKTLDKWVHIGRINTPHRWDYFEEMGADSCDGTGLSRYTHMRKAVSQPTLLNKVSA